MVDLERVGGVIIHHKNFPAVLGTVDSLLSQGIKADRLLVVDNSEDAELAGQLARALPDLVTLDVVPNGGYAAAANHAARHFESRGGIDYVLLSTHEVILEGDALTALLAAVDADPSIAVAGPTLMDASATDEGTPRVWSMGGKISPVLGWPAHERSLPSAASAETIDRAWLDGALCLYRLAALREGMLEDFFLYTEELEFHTRLRASGRRVVWVPGATAQQSTGGAPAFLQARNLQIYYRLWGTPLQRTISVLLIIGRNLVAGVLGRSSAGSVRDGLRGWRSGQQYELGSSG